MEGWGQEPCSVARVTIAEKAELEDDDDENGDDDDSEKEDENEDYS